MQTSATINWPEDTKFGLTLKTEGKNSSLIMDIIKVAYTRTIFAEESTSSLNELIPVYL